MYLTKDITNILNSKEVCIAAYGDKICNQVKKGNFTLYTVPIHIYKTLTYLLSIVTSDCGKLKLIDYLQDLCDNCNSSTLDTIEVSECPTNAIVSEDNICLITESGVYIIQE